MFMMPRLVPELSGALGSIPRVDEPVGPIADAPRGAPWMPPAGRDTSNDAALFAPYADCGPGAVTNAVEGTCEVIPGYAEGFAEVEKITRMMDAERSKRGRLQAARQPRRDALEECFKDGWYEAQEECDLGRLPLESRPAGMSAAECQRLWRNGFGGATETRQQATDDRSSTSLTRGATGTLGGELDVGGLKLGASGEERTEANDSHEHTRSRGSSSTASLRPFRGYLEQCRDEVAARFGGRR